MKLTKIISLLLVMCMFLGVVVSCKKKVTPDPDYADPYKDKTHQEVSDELYNKVLGDFNKYYQDALKAESVSERWALMAIAEAKLLESGIMLPSTANGGNFAISRVVPYTITPVLWGNDSDRFYKALIVDGDPLTPAERDEMKAKWKELQGTGGYEAWAKEYLTGKGRTFKDEYGLGYSADPNTWDVFATYQSADFEAIVNTYDGLYEYNGENVQVPALAESYTVSEDGLTYTFKIRQGVKWVDSQGNPIEDLTAKSFVAGMHHLLDAKGGMEYLVSGVIKNAAEYMGGDITDFEQVGVKAKDDYTLEYTLEAPCTYFTTMLGYGVFAPLSDVYFKAQGGVYGVEEFAEAKQKDTYVYGTSYDKIAYCGPYLVTSATATNSIIFDSNPLYWNKDNVNIKKISWTFVDTSNPTFSYDLMMDGTFAGAGLNANAVEKAKKDNMFDKYAYVAGTDAGSYPLFFNLYRKAYANYNDATIAVSELTENSRIKANLAMQNQHFRMALAMSLDRGAYNATTVGDDLKLTSLVNSYTPGNYVKLEENITVDINGKPTEFTKGTYYGAIMQAQIDADGVKLKVWDPEAEAGVGSSAGYDGWYNVDNARAELEKAVEELKKAGLVIDADHPVILEVPYCDVSEVYSNRANALKQSIEKSLNGLIKIQLVKTGGTDATNWYYAGYYPATGDLMNYNIYDGCGWGPDYGDPSTYLNTMLPQGGGMAKNIGLY